MRTTAIALSLGLGLGLSLPSFAASLAEQFTLMEEGPTAPSIPRLFSHDGVDIKAWVDPACHHRRTHPEQAGQTGRGGRYYFRAASCSGVKARRPDSPSMTVAS